MNKELRPTPPINLPQNENTSVAWQEFLVHMPALVFAGCFVAILFLTLLVYLPSTGHGFVMDDHGQILDNPKIQSAGNVFGYFKEDVWEGRPNGSSNYYRPLFLVWLRLHFWLYGASPAGWHFSSILAQLAVTLLLGILVWTLLKNRAACLLAMAVFALHPSHVESVSYVSAVPDPLMSIAILGCVLLFLKWVGLPQEEQNAKPQRPSKVKSKFAKRQLESGHGEVRQGSIAWLIGSIICFAVALLLKEPAVLFPLLILVILASIRGQRSGAWRQAVAVTLPYAALAAGYLIVRGLVLNTVTGGTLSDIALPTFVLSLPATAWFYIQAMIFPFHSMAFANSPLVSQVTLGGVLLPLLGVVLFVALLAVASRWILSRPADGTTRGNLGTAVWTGWLLMALPLLPTMNLRALISDDLLHGRYAYLPTAGLALLLACAWHRLGDARAKSALLAASAALLLVFAGLTARQERAWKTDLLAWQAGYEVAPKNAAVLQHYCAELLRARHVPEALPVAQAWTQSAPQNWRSWATTAECYMKLGRFAEAEAPINRAAQLNPDDPRVHMEQSIVRSRLGH